MRFNAFSVSKSAEGGELTVVEFEEAEGMSALEGVEGDIGGLLTTRDIETELRRLYGIARKRASVQLRRYSEHATAQLLPDECPYTIDQILAEDWYPDPVDRANGDTA